MQDVDTQGVCTGACCQNFTLCIDGTPLPHASVAEAQNDPTWRMQAEAENDLMQHAVPASEETRFNCSKFDCATKRCTIYDQRPATCRSFPKGAVIAGKVTDTCHHCGFTAGAE